MRLIRFGLLSSFLMVATVAFAKSPVRLQFTILDARTKEPVSGVSARVIRDFNAVDDDAVSPGAKETAPFKYFTAFSSADNKKIHMLGYLEPSLTETSSVLVGEIDFDLMNGARNVWVELSKPGYHTSFRSLWSSVNENTPGVYLARTFTLMPKSPPVEDYSKPHTIRGDSLQIDIPAGVSEPGTSLTVDLLTDASGSHYASFAPSIHAEPILILGKLQKPVTVTFKPQGQSIPFVFTLAKINLSDYSLKPLKTVKPNEGKSIEPPFIYTATIDEGGLYVFVN